jgi:hypothetical protein
MELRTGQAAFPPNRMRAFRIVAVALLSVNWLSVVIAQPFRAALRDRLRPDFIDQLEHGKAKILSKCDTIKRSVMREVVYPAESLSR